MPLTLVITVFNERDTVLEAIRQVAALDVDKEIIVVDNYSPAEGLVASGKSLKGSYWQAAVAPDAFGQRFIERDAVG